MNNTTKNKCALLLIDVISDFEFEHGAQLFSFALPMAKRIALLKEKAKQLSIPVIYVNDHNNNWRASFHDIINHCLQEHFLGKQIVEILLPSEDDYFILKPSYSGFYATPLHLLLENLQVSTVIITGIAGNMCVQFTANDAFMLKYQLYIPSDCVASNTIKANRDALTYMKQVLKANTDASLTIDLKNLVQNN